MKQCFSSNALENRFKYGVIYNSMGLIYYKRHNLERVIESFQIAIDLNPQAASVHVNLGRIYSSWQNLDRALDQYLWPLRSNLSQERPTITSSAIYALRKQKRFAIRMVEKTVGSDKKIARMTRADEVQNISNSLEFQHSVQLDN